MLMFIVVLLHILAEKCGFFPWMNVQFMLKTHAAGYNLAVP